jgi:hypothetical protein
VYEHHSRHDTEEHHYAEPAGYINSLEELEGPGPILNMPKIDIFIAPIAVPYDIEPIRCSRINLY